MYLSYCTPRNSISSRSYLESRANIMLPRLYSLTLDLFDAELLQIQSVYTQPLQLRYMDAQMWLHDPDGRYHIMPPLMDMLPIDISYFRWLKLRGVDLPWPVLPETKLTHLTFFFPINPPRLSQLVAILASCPLLQELQLEIRRRFEAEWASHDSLVDLHNLKDSG